MVSATALIAVVYLLCLYTCIVRLNVLQSNIFGSTSSVCIFPITPMQRLLTGIISPVICFGLLGIIVLCVAPCRIACQRRYPAIAQYSSLIALQRSITFLALLSYSSMVTVGKLP